MKGCREIENGVEKRNLKCFQIEFHKTTAGPEKMGLIIDSLNSSNRPVPSPRRAVARDDLLAIGLHEETAVFVIHPVAKEKQTNNSSA